MSSLLQRKIGKTPLLRAKNLENALGISKIFLKLEGTNPSEHIEDRLAYSIIKDAVSIGKNTICLAVDSTIGASFAFLAGFFPKMHFIFYVPARTKIHKKDVFSAPNISVVETGLNYRQCVEKSRQESYDKNWYNANPGFENSVLNMCSFSAIAEEIATQAKEEINTIFCQTWNGFAIAGLHLGFKQLFINDKIDKIPEIHATSTAHGNAIIESYNRGSMDLITLSKNDVKKTRSQKSLINMYCSHGQGALNAIFDSHGTAIGVTDEELVKYSREFKRLEKVKISPAHSYALAGFIKHVQKNGVENGCHVIVMNDGRVDIDIAAVHETGLPVSSEEIVARLSEWLGEYGDPAHEIMEAVQSALKTGFIIYAVSRNDLAGLCVIVNLGFETFARKYHLAYIATGKNIKGRGIATQILAKAEELTGGNLSLHVELDNTRAIKVYEKMGFKKGYLRMLHEGRK